jgi:hypothetical protein
MTRRIYLLFMVAAASGALIAGCGSSSSKPKTPAKTTPAKTTPAKTTPATTTPTATSTGPSSPGGAAAAADCEASLKASTTLTASEKSQLSGVCSELASGNAAEDRAAEQKICTVIVKAVPAAEQALAKAECSKIAP